MKRIPQVQVTGITPVQVQSALNQIVSSMNSSLEELERSMKSNLRTKPDKLPVGAIWNDNGVVRQVNSEA